MSKNLTRKGLALSAVVALGTSLFAGAPAQAAAAINIAPSAGTGYTVLGSDTFTLKAFGNADFSVVTATALRWKITKPAANSTVAFIDGGNNTLTGSSVVADTTNNAIVYVDPTHGTDVLGGNTLNINPTTSAAADVVYKVQAYIESDSAAGLGSTETASAEQTITFSGTAIPTITLDPVAKDVAVSGKVTYAASGFNYNQTTTTATRVVFTVNGTDRTATTTAAREDTYLTVTDVALTVASGDVISAVAQAIRFDGDTTYGVSASAGASAGTSTANEFENTVTSGANVTVNSGANYYVRTGTKSVSFTTQFLKTGVAVAAGQPVTIKLQESGTTLDTTDVVKVNGVTVDNGAAGSNTGAEKAVNVTTGTNGVVTVTIDNTYASVGDKVAVKVLSGAGVASNTLTFEWADAELKGLKQSDAPLVDGASSYTNTIVRGSSYSATYALVDQFGEKWTSANTATTYRLNAYRKSTDLGAASWSAVQAVFASGVATLTFKDDSTANTGYRVSVDVERLQGGTGNWTAGSNDADVTSTELWFKPVTTASVTSKITLKEAISNNKLASDTDGVASNAVDRSTATLARLDRRAGGAYSSASLALLAAQGAKVTGVVTRADGSVSAGAAVTLSSPGIFFSTTAAGDTYVSADSITVLANESGVYTVYVYSNAGGTKTITTTSGSATATQKIKFAAALASKGTAIKITAPDYSAAGRSVDVSVLLTDKFGAPVQSTSASPLRVSVTGAGSYTTIAADSDADGLVSFKLIFGANETGVATIKATYDAANDGTVDLTVTKTVTIGSAPAAAATAAVSGSTGKFYVSATAAAGKLVVVKVAGKFVTSFKATGSKKSVAVKSSKGSKKVTVYVGGKLVATKTVTVK